MKKLTLSLLIAAATAAPAFAGVQVVTTEYKQPVVLPPPCFRDQEVALDLFYSFNDARAKHNTGYRYRDGSGGGVGVTYFFARYFGIGVEGNWWEGIEHRDEARTKRGRNWKYDSSDKVWRSNKTHDAVAHQVTGTLILRYPVELSNFCFAPYIFGGGGGIFNGEGVGFGTAGAGVEWRATQHFGLFADWRWNWVEKSYNDVHSTRAGVRFIF